MSLPEDIANDAKEQSWKEAIKELEEGQRREEILSRAKGVLEPVELTPEVTREVTFEEIAEILSSTIKKDDPAKLITFSAMLLAQTESDQINIGFQSESSAGKSYIPMELASYFPQKEVIPIAGASPMAFFHDRGNWDDARKVIVIDLENKILLFLDQPHYLLLEKLRPVLSHDKKELEYKITDKNKGGQNKTKNIVIRGFPMVVFSTTKMNPDEQEKTRMILLSPSIDQDKLKESLELLAMKKGNIDEYEDMINKHPKRRWLMDRIRAMRERGVKEIRVPDYAELVLKRFMEKHGHLMARNQRDFPRIFSMIKAHALLNCFNRECKDNRINATKEDIDAGFKLYETIEESNEMGLSPHILKIYKEVIKPLLTPEGTDKKAIRQRYYKIFRKFLDDTAWTKELLPQLEAGGLISQEQDPLDKRKVIYLPTENVWETSGGNGTVDLNTMIITPPPDHSHISPPTKESQFWETYQTLKAILTTVSYNAFVGELMSTKDWKQEEAEKWIGKMEQAGKLMGVPNDIVRI